MKTYNLMVTFIAATAFVVGCKPADEKSPNDKPVTQGMDAAAQQIDKVKQDTKELVKDVNEYAYAQRLEFAEKMRAQLNDINKELDTLASRVENSAEPAKSEGKAKLQVLKDKVAALNKQLDEIKDANESKWDEIKAGFRKSMDDVKDSFTQARQWLSDKIAP